MSNEMYDPERPPAIMETPDNIEGIMAFVNEWSTKSISEQFCPDEYKLITKAIDAYKKENDPAKKAVMETLVRSAVKEWGVNAGKAADRFFDDMSVW